MKTFKDVRSKTSEKNDSVFDKKIDNVKVVVKKEKNGYTVYIDGDKLDTYPTAAEANKMGVKFAKELNS